MLGRAVDLAKVGAPVAVIGPGPGWRPRGGMALDPAELADWYKDETHRRYNENTLDTARRRLPDNATLAAMNT